MSKLDDDRWMDLRHTRAQQMTAMVMQVIDKYLEHSAFKRCASDLFAAFHDAGVEVITDDIRARMGLPPRDVRGWTREELAALEAKRLELMLQPLRFEFPVLTAQERAELQNPGYIAPVPWDKKP